MRCVWVLSFAWAACGRIDFQPVSGDATPGGGDGDGAVAPLAPLVVTNVVTVGAAELPLVRWDGQAFAALLTSPSGTVGYQAFTADGIPLTAKVAMPTLGYVGDVITVPAGIGVIHAPVNDRYFAVVDRSGTVTSNVLVQSGPGGGARVAKNSSRNELCLVWADSDIASPRQVRAARATLTGTKIGADLIVSANTAVGYRRIAVACRDDELFVMYAEQDAIGNYDYFISTYLADAPQLVDVPIPRANIYDMVLMGASLAAPLIAHGDPGVNVRIGSFDPAAPSPLGGSVQSCRTQFATTEWDGSALQIGAACMTGMQETTFVWTVDARGDLVRPPVEVHPSAVYGGGSYQIATSPSGHVAYAFSEYDVANETQIGFLGFLAPP